MKKRSPQGLRFFLCCGGRIRTCDLQVMSLASYQLLHSAMLTFTAIQDVSRFAAAKVRRFFELTK